MSEQPLVSVFIPYYNDAEYLKQAIESVISQTYQNWELILLNHATTDNCREIAHSYNDSRIKHIDMDKNYGAGGGILFRKFLKVAAGKYIKPLCADDVLINTCLEDLVSYMEENEDISYAFGGVNCIDKNSNLLHTVFFENYGFNINNSNIDELKMFKKGIGHSPWPAVILRTRDISQIDIDNILIMEFDMSIYLELLVRGCNVGFLDKKVLLYRLHESQMSQDKNGHNINYINDFEIPLFLNILYKIQSVELVKKVFDDAQYAVSLSEGDEKFIPFVIAHYYTYSDSLLENKCGYQKLYEILNNEDLRIEIEKKFNYTVGDFRFRYKSKPIIEKYEVIKICEQPKKVNKIFSISKFENHKIIYLFGVKISLKNHKN